MRLEAVANDVSVREVLQAERALYRAMIEKDFTALGRMLSPDLVYGHSTAIAETKEEYLAGVAKGLYEYESIASDHARVRIYAPVALVSGICDMKVGVSGQP